MYITHITYRNYITYILPILKNFLKTKRRSPVCGMEIQPVFACYVTFEALQELYTYARE